MLFLSLGDSSPILRLSLETGTEIGSRSMYVSLSSPAVARLKIWTLFLTAEGCEVQG